MSVLFAQSSGAGARPPTMSRDGTKCGPWRHGGYEISTDPARINLDVIHGFLQSAYWCYGIPRRALERSIDHSLPFGLFGPDGEQVGFARVISDRAQGSVAPSPPLRLDDRHLFAVPIRTVNRCGS
jgi:hypothetical protein